MKSSIMISGTWAKQLWAMVCSSRVVPNTLAEYMVWIFLHVATTMLQETPSSSTDKKKDQGTRRLQDLTQEQKDKIAMMSSPSEMPYEERKRQYAALRRSVASSCKPALLAKFSLSNDAERLVLLSNQTFKVSQLTIHYENDITIWWYIPPCHY